MNTNPSNTTRRAERHRQQQARARRRLIGWAILIVVVVVGAIVAIVALTGGDDKPSTPAFEGSTVTLSLSEYKIAGNLEVPTGPVRMVATNIGGLVHNVGVRGVKISRNLARGESATLDLGVLAPGTYELYCDVIDSTDNVSHVKKGMVAQLVVTPASTSTSAAIS